jgi:DNA-binding transcriptional regulator LsrR (DeoR family)
MRSRLHSIRYETYSGREIEEMKTGNSKLASVRNSQIPGKSDTNVQRKRGRRPQTLNLIGRKVVIDSGEFTYDELVSIVCNYFCKGYPAAQIRSTIEEKYEVKLKREDPWRMLNWAGTKGWLRTVSPLDRELSENLQNRYPWLKRADVVNTCVTEDVSNRMAHLLLELIRDFRQDHPDDNEVHVGFAGGSALKKSAAILATLLREEWQELPKKLVFHAMVANFNLKDPTSDPNAFFTYLGADAGIPIDTEFVSLLAPGFVKSTMRGELLQIDEVDWAVRQASEIDIFVTSAGGHWEEGHSALYDMYRRKSDTSLKVLRERGCVGDLSWLPISAAGPIEEETEFRATTLLELGALIDQIHKGKKVLLMVGPCGECRRPKDDVLRAILEMRPHPITHLVAESRAVRAVL